ncbi:SidA/IucD/PvdA family monooxygenase, partial [Streptomyces durbertensis]
MLDLVIVGAGPYGLSIAAHAAAAGLRLRTFGRPMASWRDHMPAGMFLKSEPWSSNLSAPGSHHTLGDYCQGRGLTAEHGTPVPIETFTDYGLWFARQAVPEVDERVVTSVAPNNDHWHVTIEDGETVATRAVVLAVGVMPFVNLPAELRDLPSDLVTHSSHHRDLSRFTGLDVTVVGGGQAALETATLLAEAGAAPRLLARADQLNWNTPPQPLERPLLRSLRDPHCGLGTGWPSWVWSETPWLVRRLPAALRLRINDAALGPAGAWWLRERCEERVPLLLARRLRAARAQAGRVRLETTAPDGGTETYVTDHVIAATGFAPELDRLTLLDPAARSALRTLGGGRTGGGAPELGAGFRSSLPGLYFAGLLTAPAFGPAMRFVYGAAYTAERLVHAVRRATPVRQLPRPTATPE